MTRAAVSSEFGSSTVDRVRKEARRIAVQGVAGLIAGVLVGGIGGRIAMRISAAAAGDDLVGVSTENGNRVGTISFDGTVELIVFAGALTGAVAAILIVILRPWLRWAGRWQGPAMGVALLGIAGATVIEAANRDFLILEPRWLNIAMFAALIVGYGWLAIAGADWWLARDVRPAPFVFHAAPIALGAPLMIPLFATFFSEEFCACNDPMWVVGMLVTAVALATAALIFGEITGRSERRWRLQPIGIGLFALAFAAGFVRLVDEIMAII